MRQRVRCLDAVGLELGELQSLPGAENSDEAGELAGEVAGESNGEQSGEEGDGVDESQLSSDKSTSSRFGNGKVISCGSKSNSMSVAQGGD